MLQASIFGLKIVYSSFDASVVANAQLCPWVGTVENLKSVAIPQAKHENQWKLQLFLFILMVDILKQLKSMKSRRQSVLQYTY